MQEFIRDQKSWHNVSLINGNHFSQERVFHSSPLVYEYKQHSLYHHNVTQFNFAFLFKMANTFTSMLSSQGLLWLVSWLG